MGWNTNMFPCISRTQSEHTLRGDDLQSQIYELKQFYQPMDLQIEFYNHKVTAIKKLNNILKNADRKALQGAEFRDVVQCALTLVYFFGMRLKTVKLKSKYSTCKSRRQFLKAEAAFQKTMDQFLPELSEEIILRTFQFFSDIPLWAYEDFVTQILEVILYLNNDKMILFNMLLTDIHRVLFVDVKSARHRLRVLYELLNSEHFVIDNRKLLPFVTRLLDFFAQSIKTKPSVYKYVRKGFEVCLQRIFLKVDNNVRLTIITTMLNWFSMTNMNDDDVLEFSWLLDNAAQLYKVRLYSDSLSEGVMGHILMKLVGSRNAAYSLIGFKLLERFLDRNSNSNYLFAPSIFFEFTNVPLVIGKYNSGDKAFFRHHRDYIQTYFLQACKLHCHNMTILKALYCVLCIMVLEVPCSFTAAGTACIAMAIQEYALSAEHLLPRARYWLHAVVISTMSLICWVHKASFLYSYINEIVYRRAKEAPYMNPPLKPRYENNYRTENKPDFFIEDWELRYALWKHFRDVRVKMENLPQRRVNNKIPQLKIS